MFIKPLAFPFSGGVSGCFLWERNWSIMFSTGGRAKDKCSFNSGRQAKKQQRHKSNSNTADLPCRFVSLHLFSKHVCLGMVITSRFFLYFFFYLRGKKKNKPPRPTCLRWLKPLPPPSCFSRSPPPAPPVSLRGPRSAAGAGDVQSRCRGGLERSVPGTAVTAAVKHRQQRGRGATSSGRSGAAVPGRGARSEPGAAAPATPVPHTGVVWLRPVSLVPADNRNTEGFFPSLENGWGRSFPSLAPLPDEFHYRKSISKETALPSSLPSPLKGVSAGQWVESVLWGVTSAWTPGLHPGCFTIFTSLASEGRDIINGKHLHPLQSCLFRWSRPSPAASAMGQGLLCMVRPPQACEKRDHLILQPV